MLLYNEKCSCNKTFSKWFFYVIYPLHKRQIRNITKQLLRRVFY